MTRQLCNTTAGVPSSVLFIPGNVQKVDPAVLIVAHAYVVCVTATESYCMYVCMVSVCVLVLFSHVC